MAGLGPTFGDGSFDDYLDFDASEGQFLRLKTEFLPDVKGNGYVPWQDFPNDPSGIGLQDHGSTISTMSRASTDSTTLSLLSVPTEASRPCSPLSTRTARPQSREMKPRGAFCCLWAGCSSIESFATKENLAWHINVEHVGICPVAGCGGVDGSSRMIKRHVAVSHPAQNPYGVSEWQLEAKILSADKRTEGPAAARSVQVRGQQLKRTVERRTECRFETFKRRCLQQANERLAKKARRDGAPVMRLDHAPFPFVFEHLVLPFLKTHLPEWAGPRHSVLVTRGKTLTRKRICITTPCAISRIRKIIICQHVMDLLPHGFKKVVSLVFATGEVERIGAWARGLTREMPDDICSPRNPFYFESPRMGDSIGIKGSRCYEASTATLGPCLRIGDATLLLCNFHPFLEAFRGAGWDCEVEHPSPQDRARCTNEAHDVLPSEGSFGIGELGVTSGLTLETTRLSHEPYWEDNLLDAPLVVTDWALLAVTKPSAQANILRRFPSETAPPVEEQPITSTSNITPGATVSSSGRSSGYQKGQVCQIPAYVSGAENGTTKATREWFIEEPWGEDDEESWIRGGIGIEGDSGAAIVDAESNTLIGQLWARNKYWGPGPRVAYFTPMVDILDDIQEKCGQETRPQLPEPLDNSECYPVHPNCRRCYDLRTYLESRRSSRMSLQSMIIGRGDADQDLTSIEAVSELATPREFPARGMGLEEAGASFNNILSPMASLNAATPAVASDTRSPYAQTLDLDDEAGAQSPGVLRKRPMPLGMFLSDDLTPPKRRKANN